MHAGVLYGSWRLFQAGTSLSVVLGRLSPGRRDKVFLPLYLKRLPLLVDFTANSRLPFGYGFLPGWKSL